MYEQLLTQTGLSANQATIYELLLQLGPSKASKISQKSPLKRGLVYKILDELLALKLAKKEEKPGAIAVYTAEHPTLLRDMVKDKEEQIAQAKTSIEQLLPQITSQFNLAVGKPGVRFYEGLEGIRQVWWDSLNNTEEICTYGDLEAIAKNYGQLNEEYLKERKKRGIKKRGITNDSETNRNFLKNYDSDITVTKLIGGNTPIDFSDTVMQIYNNKISYTTLNNQLMIGVIIEDALIYQMNKNLFDWLWSESTTEVTSPDQPA